MATVGVGKAFRDTQRAGRQSRARSEVRVGERRRRTQSAAWEDTDGTTDTCASCGVEDDVGDMYFGAEGLTCAHCFSQHDGLVAAPPLPSAAMVVLGPLVYSLLWVPFGLHAAGLSPLYWASVGGGLLALAWIAAMGVSLLGSPWLLMHIAGRAREDYRRVGLEEGQERWLVAGHLWHALVFVGAAGGAWWAILFRDALL